MVIRIYLKFSIFSFLNSKIAFLLTGHFRYIIFFYLLAELSYNLFIFLIEG